jgi:hypothetical protein
MADLDLHFEKIPDQLAWMCRLIWICTLKKILISWMCRLI